MCYEGYWHGILCARRGIQSRIGMALEAQLSKTWCIFEISGAKCPAFAVAVWSTRQYLSKHTSEAHLVWDLCMQVACIALIKTGPQPVKGSTSLHTILEKHRSLIWNLYSNIECRLNCGETCWQSHIPLHPIKKQKNLSGKQDMTFSGVIYRNYIHVYSI